jgi:membrane protein DedA with SNARE-associated domain/rhodanese-related sulfurtransferase
VQDLVSLIEQHGLLVIFLNVLLCQSGLPVPVYPTLMTAAALVTQSRYQIPAIILAGVGGSLIPDLALYWIGARHGRRVLGLLCKVSLSPDFCVRQTETVFARVGPSSLLFAKFVPGLSSLSVAMAGITKMSLPAFLLLNGTGAFLFVSVPVVLGRIFQNEITGLLSTLARVGAWGVLIVLAALGCYLLARWWRRQAFIRRLRMARITVSELRGLIDDGRKPLILDVRSKGTRAREGIIPGAVSAHPTDIDPVVMAYSHELEIIVYCACPNEASAAIAAMHLKRAGFKQIRPLLGGINAWIQAGYPVERDLFDAANSASPVAAAANAK